MKKTPIQTATQHDPMQLFCSIRLNRELYRCLEILAKVREEKIGTTIANILSNTTDNFELDDEDLEAVAPLEADEVIGEVEISRDTFKRIEVSASARRLTMQAAIELFLTRAVERVEQILGDELC